MSGEGEFAKSSKRKHKTFNQRKERWLMKKLSREGPPTEEDIQARLAQLPLKYRSLATLLCETPNEYLLVIKRVFDDVVSSRSQSVEIVLKREKYEAASDWGHDVYDELGRIITKEDVKARSPDLDKKTRRQLATYLFWHLKLPPEDPDESVDEYQKSLEYNRRLEERITRKNIEMELIIVLGKERLSAIDRNFQEIIEETDFNHYHSYEPTNRHLIRALKNLERRKVEVKTMLLYTLELPLGASYEIGFDAKYGEYPIITGC